MFETPGERRLAEALVRELPDDWIVITNYQLPVPGTTREIDAVVIHPEGIIILDHKSWRGSLHFKGGRVYKDERYLGRDPRNKIDDNAKKLNGWIQKHAGIDARIESAIVVENGAEYGSFGGESVPILHMSEVVPQIRQGRVTETRKSRPLSAKEIQAIADCLLEDRKLTALPFQISGYTLTAPVEGDPFEEYWATHARGKRVRVYRVQLDETDRPGGYKAEVALARRMYDVLTKLERLRSAVLPRGHTFIEDSEDDSSFWIVYEGVDGVPIDAANWLAPEEKLRALIATAEALSLCHGEYVLHRALSPDCVLIERASWKPRLIHFQFARYAENDSQTILPRVANRLRELPRTPPEMRQSADLAHLWSPAADVYSLGVVAAEAFAGRRMKEPADLEGLLRTLKPSAVRPVIERMVAPIASERIHTMRDVVLALGDLRRLIAPRSMR